MLSSFVAALLLSASLFLGVPVPSTQPQIEFDRSEGCGYGAYNIRTRTVHLSERWDSTRPYCVATLLHELVHHVQYENAVQYECMGARQADAYDLQSRYLVAQGMRPARTQTTLQYMRSCPVKNS